MGFEATAQFIYLFILFEHKYNGIYLKLSQRKLQHVSLNWEAKLDWATGENRKSEKEKRFFLNVSLFISQTTAIWWYKSEEKYKHYFKYF